MCFRWTSLYFYDTVSSEWFSGWYRSMKSEAEKKLESIEGKVIKKVETDYDSITLVTNDGVEIVISRGFSEDFVPDNSFLTVNGLEL